MKAVPMKRNQIIDTVYLIQREVWVDSVGIRGMRNEPSTDTQNLPRIHEQYKAKIPAVKYREIYIGFTALTFCKWEKVPQKNQAETPYSEEGRELNFNPASHRACDFHRTRRSINTD